MTIFLTLGVVVAALICFITEWLPVDITALCIAVVLIVLGLVTPDEGIAGFGNSATITVMAMFILSAGITRTGVVQVFRDLLLKWGGKSVTRQILVMGILVGPISAFINNTAVVAIFLPIVEEWCKKRGISPSKLLMPLSFVTVLGGMITVIGTSTNVLASGIAKDLGYGEFGLFQFSALGIITFLIGLAYLALIAPRLLPNRKNLTSDLVSEGYGLEDYVTEVIVSPTSKLIGQTFRSAQLQRDSQVDVLEIIRDRERLPQPVTSRTIRAEDILLVRGKTDDVLKIRAEQGLDILPDVKFNQKTLATELNSSDEGVAEVLILSNSRLIGSTLKDLRFRQRYNLTVLALRRGEELLRERLGRVPLKFGDLLLVQGDKQSLLGLQTTRELLVIEQKEPEAIRRDKAWLAIAIILGVVLIAAFDLLPILVSALMGVVLMIVTGVIKPGEVYGAVRWDVIFLLAGLIPLGTAMENSGATKWLADNLMVLGGNFSGYWILLFFYIITSLLTEILSNNATVVLLLPIAAEVAKALSLSPISLMFAVTFAASNSFMTPIGYQTNTMVYGPGGYKFWDFFRVGAPLNLLMTIFTPLLIMWLYGL
ncbi:MAG: SLC13 family permease [Pleurocapsa minor HA4230-MV1]|jgi:di/tricarboxylate transporter|nr:SLC13 family permease [Pleurocapsa minor HA4230-MV1]